MIMFNSGKHLPPGGPQIDHDRLVNLINSLSDGFLAIDPDGLIELSNSAALNLLDSNQLDSKNISEVLDLADQENRTVDFLSLVKKSKQSFASRNYSLRQSQDSLINLFISVSAVKQSFGNRSGGGYVVLLRDITREKNLEKERDEFISVASHELRSPVTIAEGSVSNALLIANQNQLPDPVKQTLQSAHGQLVFLQALISDLAMLSRADRGKLTVIIEEIDLKEIVDSLVHDYLPQAAKKNLELKFETDKNIKKIFSAKLYVREILQNFLTNAIKYTEKGSVVIKIANNPDGVNLSVSDTGIGIDGADQARLFSKFYRSGDTRVRQISGTGLGLYISAKLAKLIGGNITMQSQLNQGSTFSLNLPNSAYHHPASQKPA